MSIWNIDPDHSVISFVIKHMMVTDVHGQFNSLSGTIQFDPVDINGTSIEFQVDAGGIFTGIQKRDDHLKSQDFFDVEKCPVITFKSSKCKISNSNSCKVTGDLAIHGITRSLTGDVEFFGPIKSPFGETSMGFTGKAVINREDFGLTWNMPLENGGLMVSRDVYLSIDIEADLVEE